ncbi:MAG: hypothetical protein IKI64_03055 [Clostridia bacterium]|nr:hypothetical protein [Clostridia bacterium]
MTKKPIHKPVRGQIKTDAPDEAKGAESAPKREGLFKSSFYNRCDIDAAAENAYNSDIDEAELKKQRRRDWIFILIGVPAFIAFMYLLVMIFRGAH